MNIVKEFINGFTSNSTDQDIKSLEEKIASWLDINADESIKERKYSLFGSKKNYSEYTPNNICLFVHLYKPIRKLGTILPAPKSIRITTLPSKLQYCILPIAFDETSPNKMNIHDRKPINIITKKRGMWLIVEGFEHLEKKGTEEIYDIYKKYVEGMQFNPKNCNYETLPQYNLAYPSTLTWKQGEKIIYKRKQTKVLTLNNNKPRKTRKRKKAVKPPVVVDDDDDDLLATSSDTEHSNTPKKKKKGRFVYNISDSLKILPLIRSTEGLLEGDRENSSEDGKFDMTDEFYTDRDGNITNKDVYDIDEENNTYDY